MNLATSELNIDEAVWKDLLSFIEDGQVLPILGQGVMTIGPNNQLLMPWLAQRLAEELKISTDSLSETPTLNEVVCRYLMSNGNRTQLIHQRLHRIVKEGCPEPGVTLQQLATIDPFRLFISTTFDPLLAKTLNAHREADRIQVCEYAPNAESKDIPNRKHLLSKNSTVIYHILGKSSATGNFVVWEDDMMEFILGLHKDLSASVMPNLSKDLADPNLHYLILGLNFCDWLVRFFVRAARQTRLSESCRTDYIADEPETSISSGLVMFFGSVDRSLHVFQCDPRHFVTELARRWQQHPKNNPVQQRVEAPITPPIIPSKAARSAPIFVSYAREDLPAALNFVNQMRKAGFTMWLDQSELDSGTNYQKRLQEMIESCGCFVSLISQNTEAQEEAFFHLERSWAADRAAFWAEEVQAEYYIPIIVDGTGAGEIRHEPSRFSRSQRERLLNGQVTDRFVARMHDIIAKRLKSK